MNSYLRLLKTFVCVAASFAAAANHSAAQAPTNVDSSSLIVNYSADALLNGSSVSSWSPFSGSSSEAATVAGATATGGGDIYTAPTVAKTDAAFNGHQYVSFISSNSSFQGLGTATNLGLNGTGNMTVGGVYVAPTTANDAGIAGLGSLNPGSNFNVWFDLEDRTYLVTGNPYLAGYANDLNSGGSPSGEAGVLTFALGTYSVSGSSATFSLYWAYGLTGAVQSTSATLNAVNTSGTNFEIGYNAQDYNVGAASPIEIGQAIAYNSALSGADATDEIHNLQAFYAAAVPEPSTYALMAIGLLAGAAIVRRRFPRPAVI